MCSLHSPAPPPPPPPLEEVGELETYPELQHTFSFNRYKDSALQEDVEIPRETLFQDRYSPGKFLGSGVYGIVFESTPKFWSNDAEAFGNLYLESNGKYQFIDNNVLPPLATPPNGLKRFKVAIKIIPIELGGIADNEEEERMMKEIHTHEYLTKASVGMGSDVNTLTPVVKLYDWCKLHMTLETFFQVIAPSISYQRFAETESVKRLLNNFLAPQNKIEKARLEQKYKSDANPVDRVKQHYKELFETVFNAMAFEFLAVILELVEGGDLEQRLQIGILRDAVPLHRTLARTAYSSVVAAAAECTFIHCLCSIHLFHTLLRGNHFDDKPTNWFLRVLPDFEQTYIRYTLARNMTLYIPAAATNGEMPVMGDFGMTSVRALSNQYPPGKLASGLAYSAPPSTDIRQGFLDQAESVDSIMNWNPSFDLHLFVVQFVGLLAFDLVPKMSPLFWEVVLTALTMPSIEAMQDPLRQTVFTNRIKTLLMVYNQMIRDVKRLSRATLLNLDNATILSVQRSLLQASYLVFSSGANDPTIESVFSRHVDFIERYQQLPPQNARVFNVTPRIGDFDPPLWTIYDSRPLANPPAKMRERKSLANLKPGGKRSNSGGGAKNARKVPVSMETDK